MKISYFNDRVQGWLFDPNAGADLSGVEITRPFPFNAYYEREVPDVDGDGYELEVTGLVADKRPGAGRAVALPQDARSPATSASKAGARSATGAACRSRVPATASAPTSRAKYVGFKCADDYYTSIDMPTALHPQTLLTLTFDGEILPPQYGFPMKLRMPTKLGYKNPKHIRRFSSPTPTPGGYWEDQGYNWFGGS